MNAGFDGRSVPCQTMRKRLTTQICVDTIRTIIYTGRTLRVIKTPFIMDWETNKQKEIAELTSKGIVPVGMEPEDPANRPFLSGQTAAVIHDVKPAKAIVDEIVAEAVEALNRAAKYTQTQAKL